MLPEAIAVPVRPDEDVHADVYEALGNDPEIKTLDRANVRIEVQNGVVRLSGHVASVLNCLAAEDLAVRVPGVVAVQNDLVADADLAVSISQALAEDPETRPLDCAVATFHGWVSISGEVPNEASSQAAQRVIAGVPGVRGVLVLPTVAGRPPKATRRGWQPSIGAALYTTDGWAGTVRFVVIDPGTRLVTDIGASARFDLNSRAVNGMFVVPVEAVQNVSDSGVFLTDSPEALAGRPAFDEAAFPRPAADWRPPFPYSPEAVRWQAARVTA